MRKFNSKILLFGEYSIIRNSMALSVPYSLFDGHLHFNREKNVSVDLELKAFSSYMKKLEKRDELFFDFDTTSFSFDVGQGLYFDSSIPQGYGVGSSGALCAALFARYGNSDEDDISKLKAIFSVMESHFHGSSSGVDPLISYLNSSVLISDGNNFEKVVLPKLNKGKGAIFLLNTARSRRTEPLVNLFLEKCSKEDFANLCDNVLTPITNNCITAFLEGDSASLYEFFRELSDFQFRHFAPMIPKLFKDLWQDGLKYEQFYLKLCGAGGGGFILGMTKDFNAAKELLSDHQIRPLYYFD